MAAKLTIPRLVVDNAPAAERKRKQAAERQRTRRQRAREGVRVIGVPTRIEAMEDMISQGDVSDSLSDDTRAFDAAVADVTRRLVDGQYPPRLRKK